MYSYQPRPPTESSTVRRGRIVAAILVVGLLIVVGRLVQLQIVEHRYWLDRAQASQERTIEIPPQRGTIYDRNGTVLATDVKAMAIAVDGFNIVNPEAAIAILQSALGISRSELRSKVYRDSYFTWIDRRVDFDVAQEIRSSARAQGVYGLVYIETWKRWYPQGDLASNLIGFVGTDGTGLEGLELAFDDRLRGTPSLLQVLEGADGRTYDAKVLEAGHPGADLTLSLDAGIQFICEEEITTGVSGFRAKGGMLVAMDPRSGEVLAMAQDKRYDLNSFWTSTEDSRRNLAVSHLFEPGSIFKVFTGLAALDYGVVIPSDTYDGNDGIDVSGHVMHNADNISYGTVTFAQIIEDSINTGMIRVAQQLGEERLHTFLEALGFGRSTGIELPGEERGILRPVSEWSGLALAATSIGQSVAVTGIQLARAMAVVAGDGTLPMPRITLDARDSTAPDLIVCAEGSASTMRLLMQRVVDSGTGTWAAVHGYAIAGKTGTAQKAVPGRGYVDGLYTSLFSGMLPTGSPELVLLAALDEVGTIPVSGGYTAGQIFQRAVQRLVNYLRIPPG